MFLWITVNFFQSIMLCSVHFSCFCLWISKNPIKQSKVSLSDIWNVCSSRLTVEVFLFVSPATNPQSSVSSHVIKQDYLIIVTIPLPLFLHLKGLHSLLSIDLHKRITHISHLWWYFFSHWCIEQDQCSSQSMWGIWGVRSLFMMMMDIFHVQSPHTIGCSLVSCYCNGSPRSWSRVVSLKISMCINLPFTVHLRDD